MPIPTSSSAPTGSRETSGLWFIPLQPQPLRGCSTRQLTTLLAEKKQALDPCGVPQVALSHGHTGACWGIQDLVFTLWRVQSRQVTKLPCRPQQLARH